MHLLPLLLVVAMTGVPTAAANDHPKAARAWFDHYQESRQGPEQTERFSQTYRVGADGSIDIQNISGDVRVASGRGSDIQVEAIKRVRHRDSDTARRLLEELRIEVTQVGSRVEVRTIYPRMNNRSFSGGVDYTITVPATGAVSVKTISGDVDVTGARGEVRAESVSGDVQVASTPNLAMAKTVSGDVTARDIASPTTLSLSTVSGSVIATGLKVRTLEAGTVSGNVQLSGVQIERLHAKSVSGDIEFDAPLARGGRYEFNSHSGNVRVTLPNTPGFELDASTFSGSIRSDFPVTLRSNATAASNAGNRRRENGMNRAIRGTYGDASAILSVRSFSGTVVITRR